MQRLLLIILFLPAIVFAQNDPVQNLSRTILERDSLFWMAYNNCDVNAMGGFFTADIEFYHDKGGITNGVPALEASFRDGVCKYTDSFRLRREAVPGSVHVFPMQRSGVIYGAILTGEHLFYVQEKGRQELGEGLAKFTHLWLLENNVWKMKRVLSYDHQPAPYINKRVIKQVPASILRGYAGVYKGPQNPKVVVKPKPDRLTVEIGDNVYDLYPESDSLFFMKERDITFEFVKKEGRVAKVIVREKGNMVEELTVVQ